MPETPAQPQPGVHAARLDSLCHIEAVSKRDANSCPAATFWRGAHARLLELRRLTYPGSGLGALSKSSESGGCVPGGHVPLAGQTHCSMGLGVVAVCTHLVMEQSRVFLKLRVSLRSLSGLTEVSV